MLLLREYIPRTNIVSRKVGVNVYSRIGQYTTHVIYGVSNSQYNKLYVRDNIDLDMRHV